MPKIARAYNNRDGQTSEMLSYSNSFRYEQQSYSYSSSSYRRTSKAEYDELIAKYPPVLKNHRGDVIGTIEFMI